MANSRLEEIRSIRIAKLEKLKQLGINPFPTGFSLSRINISLALKSEDKEVSVAGRIWKLREHGNVAFIDLRDESGQIQLLLQKKVLTEKFPILKLLDMGDFIGVRGKVIKTHAGEITIDVNYFEVLGKSIRPIPDDWSGLKDTEERYRKRYLDLLLDPEVRKRFDIKSKIYKETRNYLDSLGFFEVETPVFHPLYGGANAKPFVTHMNALGRNYFLRIAFELYLKRLVVGGYEKVYEIGRDFRNEGIDQTHNPEFTMIEWYEAYADYQRIMDVTEGLFKHLAQKIYGKTQMAVDDRTVEIDTKWPRVCMTELLSKKLGLDVEKLSKDQLAKYCKENKIELVGGEAKGQMIFEIFDKKVSKTLIEPTFVIDYPQEVSPLSKPHRSKPGWVERFEGYIGGKEICDGWSELTDSVIQRDRFVYDTNAVRKDKEEIQQTDEDFLEAMEYGMPPIGGIGIGMDRMTMFFTNTWTFKEILLFPTLRPNHEIRITQKISDNSYTISDNMTLTKDRALKLLNDNIQNENLRRHCLSVGVVMKALAAKLGGDPEEWEILGIIHDSDWEETKDTPERHTIVSLERIDDDRFKHALMSHNTKHTHLAELEGPMEWSLECCDELTGFIVACTLVLPSKHLSDLSVQSVLKKFGPKNLPAGRQGFCRAVDRSQISQCKEKLGIKLEDFVQIALSAMQSIAPEIGL